MPEFVGDMGRQLDYEYKYDTVDTGLYTVYSDEWVRDVQWARMGEPDGYTRGREEEPGVL